MFIEDDLSDYWEGDFSSIQVEDSTEDYVFTGLLDKDGNELYKVREKMGFIK